MRNKRVLVAAAIPTVFGGAVMFAQQNDWFLSFPDWGVALLFILSAWLALWWVALAPSIRDWIRTYRRVTMIAFVMMGAAIGAGSGWLMWWAVNRAPLISEEREEFRKTLRITFKDAPAFTPSARRTINTVIVDYLFYLHQTSIEVPRELPPIGVHVESDSSGSGIVYGAAPYRSYIMLPGKKLTSTEAIVREVSHHVIATLLGPDDVSNNYLLPHLAATELGEYFKFSYLSSKPASQGGRWVDVLWTIRTEFGQEFADRLAAYTLRFVKDSRLPPLDLSVDGDEHVRRFDEFFSAKLLMAETAVDNAESKLPRIKEIIALSGLVKPPPKPKQP